MSSESRFDKLERLPEEKREERAVEPQSLKRFEEDGGTGLHLDLTGLGQLPVRQCVECRRDSSKFDDVCIHCGESLTTLKANAHNLQLLEAQRLVKDIEVELAREKREASISAEANEEAERILCAAKEETEKLRFQRKLISIAVSLVSFIGLISVSSFAARLFCFAICLTSLGLSFERRL